jgi:hypothetical protein
MDMDMDMETWRHGDIDMETWKHGNMEKGTHRDIETWTHGHMETWKLGDMKTWTHGHIEIWTHGDMATWTHRGIQKFYEKIKQKCKMEARAIFINPFIVCSSCKRKFAVCLFAGEEINGCFLLANGLNGLNGLA